MANNFEFIGKLSAVKDTEKFKGYEQKSFDSGWVQRKTNVNVICGDDRHLLSVSGGVMTKNKKISPDATIYSFTKSDGDKKGESIKIPFADRNKPEIIDKIAGFKKFVIDTEEPGRRYALEKAIENFKDGTIAEATKDELGISTLADAEKLYTESLTKKKEFLSEWDFTQALNELVKTANNELYWVSGEIEISYNIEKGETYRNYKPTKILRAKPDAEPKSEVVFDFFYDANAVDDTSISEDGTARVNGYMRYYFSNKQYDIKGEFATETSFKIDREEKFVNGLINKLRRGFEDSIYNKIKVRCKALEGSQKESLTYDMLSDDQKADIDCGLATLDDFQTTVYGDVIRDYVFIEFGGARGKDFGKIEATVYGEDDMVAPHTTVSTDDDTDDIFG